MACNERGNKENLHFLFQEMIWNTKNPPNKTQTKNRQLWDQTALSWLDFDHCIWSKMYFFMKMFTSMSCIQLNHEPDLGRARTTRLSSSTQLDCTVETRRLKRSIQIDPHDATDFSQLWEIWIEPTAKSWALVTLSGLLKLAASCCDKSTWASWRSWWMYHTN